MRARTLDGWKNKVLPETVQHQKNLQYLSANVRPFWRWDYRGISGRELKRLKVKLRGPKASATASFRLLTALSLLLIIAGDVELNPGPLFTGTILGRDDLRNVLKEVWHLSSKWYNIGLELGLSTDALRGIEKQYPDQHDALREMLFIWLDGAGSWPTWTTLADALESRIVGAKHLAVELRTTYYSSQQVPYTTSYQDVGVACSSSGASQPQESLTDPEHSSIRMSGIPFLDIENLKEWEMDSLKGRLLEESQKMMFTFQNLVTSTSRSLTQQGVSPSDLIDFLNTLGGLEPAVRRTEKTPFDKELRNADSIGGCFLIIQNYLSFFNYHTIEHIVEKLGTDEDRSELQNYKEKLADYCKRRVFECPRFVLGLPSKSDHDLVIAKLDKKFEQYTLEQLQHFLSALSSIIGIARYSLRLVSVDGSCMEMRLQIPSFMAELVFPLSSDQERALEAEGVIWLKCGLFCFPRASLVSPPLLPHHRHDTRFPGIIFYGDPLLKMVDSDGHDLDEPEIGISLHIPPKAVPEGEILYLTVWPCLSGPFVPPEECEFSSPLYLISPAFHFHKEVELSISHFVDLGCEEDIADMSFMTSSYKPNFHESKPGYAFKLIKGGEFKLKSTTGIIRLKHFCFIGTAKRRQPKNDQDHGPEAEGATKRVKIKEERLYSVQLYHFTWQHPSRSCAVFAMSLYQRLFLENLRKTLQCQFPNHQFFEATKQPVYMSGGVVELLIPYVEGWSISPNMSPCEIYQEEVDLPFSSPDCKTLPATYPPRFLLTIIPCEQATDGECVLQVKGLNRKLNFPIKLFLSKSSLPYTVQQESQGIPSSSIGPTPLSIQDTLIMSGHPDMIELIALQGRERKINVTEEIGTNWYKFGILLLEDKTGERIKSITMIHRDNAALINMDILQQWIAGKGKMPVTWSTLVETLRDVGLTTLAADIEVGKQASTNQNFP